MKGDLSPLIDFARLYERDRLLDLLNSRFVHGGDRVVSLTPQRAHLMKDDRLVVAHRAELVRSDSGVTEIFPLHEHICRRSARAHWEEYSGFEFKRPQALAPKLRRYVERVEENSFLSVFPADPILRQIPSMCNPSRVKTILLGDLLVPGAPNVKDVELRLLAYRPERRLVIEVATVSSEGETIRRVLKLHRRSDARKIWARCRTITDRFGQTLNKVAWPRAVDEARGILLYEFVGESTLHEGLSDGTAGADHLHMAGTLLAQLHRAPGALAESDLTKLEGDLGQFTLRDEEGILERWRRLLRRNGDPVAKDVKRLVSRLDLGALPDPGHSTVLHRDFHAKQVVMSQSSKRGVIIDMDTVAWGPAALDVGNFTAHLHLRETARSEEMIQKQRSAFLQGYGNDNVSESAVLLFEFTTLIRLICMACAAPNRAQICDHLLTAARKKADQLGI